MKSNVIWAACVSALLTACGGGGGDSSSAADNSVQTADSATTAAPPKIVRGTYAFDGRTPESVVVEDRDGWAYWQGDIILSRTEDVVAGVTHDSDGRVHPLGVYIPNRLWPSGILTYDLTRLASSQRGMVMQAMKHIALYTPIRFSRDISTYSSYQDSNNGRRYDFVQFQNTSNPDLGGSSPVGHGPGARPLFLNTSLAGSSGSAITTHELVHALGGWHEQSRADRDNFVTVSRSNIKTGYEHNFDIHSRDGVMNGSYDYCSLMHYSRYAFSNGLGPTLTPSKSVSCTANRVDGTGALAVTDIGQNYGLSNGDIAMLKYRYSGSQANRPVADAGAEATLVGYGARTMQLNGLASFGVSGSTIVKYEWTAESWQSQDPNFYSTSATPVITLPITNLEPDYSMKYRLTVTDSAGRQMSDVVTIYRKKS